MAPRQAAIVAGTFSTGSRTAEVLIRDIQVWNDSENGIFDTSAYMAFDFGLYDGDDSLADNKHFYCRISSGEVRPWPFGPLPALKMIRATDSVTVYVNGRAYRGFTSDQTPPNQLPEVTTHGETDKNVWANAFQSLPLPNITGENGEDRLGFSLNSGPWGIFYIVNGYVTVRVVNPPPISVKSLADLVTATTVTLLGRTASLQAVKTRGGKMYMFGMGPDGLIAQRLPRVPKQTRWQWSLIPTDGAESAAIIARNEDEVDIITVARGTVRHGVRQLHETNCTPIEWSVIGEDMQPALNALPLADGSILLVGLTCAGDARALLLHAETGQANHWSALGGNFIGRVAALAINKGAELFAVTPRGLVEYTTWHSGDKAPAHWHTLGEDSVSHVFASADQEGKYLFALTPKREVLSMLRGHVRWPESWQKRESLDSLI
jgi:hypothetical protein